MTMLGLTGVTSIEFNVAEVTVKVVASDSAANVAVILAEPAAIPDVRPLLLTVATKVSLEDQMTVAVISATELSE